MTILNCEFWISNVIFIKSTTEYVPTTRIVQCAFVKITLNFFPKIHHGAQQSNSHFGNAVIINGDAVIMIMSVACERFKIMSPEIN